MDALIRGELLYPGARNFVTIVLGAANSEDFVILTCSVLIQITSVTDGRTDKRLDVLRRGMHSAIVRKNGVPTASPALPFS